MKTFRNDKLEMKKITISDVAEALQVSKTTVSRAISGKGRIGEATRQKFLNISKQTTISPMLLQKDWHNRKPTILHLQFPEIAIL